MAVRIAGTLLNNFKHSFRSGGAPLFAASSRKKLDPFRSFFAGLAFLLALLVRLTFWVMLWVRYCVWDLQPKERKDQIHGKTRHFHGNFIISYRKYS
jgi:hypothetical protein